MSEVESEIFSVILIAAVLAVFLIVLVVMFVVNYQRKVWKQESTVKELKLEHQKSMLESAHDAIEATQKRIATDLHDDLGASISTAKLFLQELEGGDKVADILTNSMTSLRRIVNDLMPPSLAEFGLQVALEELMNSVNQSNALVLQMDWMGESVVLTNKVELAVYRISQELLNNSLKYSKASRISLTVTVDEGELNLAYKDNGVGFDPAKVKMNVGLLNMRSRAESVGGTFAYRSSEGSGFLAKLEVPIQQTEN